MDHEAQFARIVEADGGAIKHDETGSRIDAILLKTGGALGWRPPAETGPDHREYHHAAALTRIAIRSAAKIAAIEADDRLSDSAKAQDTEAAANAARAEFEAEQAKAQRTLDAWEAADAVEAQPPTLLPTDAVGVLEDREIRDMVRSMSPDDQIKLAQQLLAGEHPRALAALLRSPFPLPPGALADVVRPAWIEQQLRSDPVAARQRREASERVAWLRERMEQTAGALRPLSHQEQMTAQAQRATDRAKRSGK